MQQTSRKEIKDKTWLGKKGGVLGIMQKIKVWS